jgi:hypothetical protein
MRDEPSCECFDPRTVEDWANLRFHAEKQDTQCDGWRHLLDLVEEASADGREEFNPRSEMTHEEWSQIVTLPSTISKLKSVKHLVLYISYLVRIPPQIGEMTELVKFTPYHSYRLHWFPYEITRCRKLKNSTVSTRALYGNFKFRPPFPKLQPGRNSTEALELGNLSPEIWGTESIATCSVCNRSLSESGLHQVWISLSVATDVLPLLVNACSEECIHNLPKSAEKHAQGPHKGGLGVSQPPSMLEEMLARTRKR